MNPHTGHLVADLERLRQPDVDFAAGYEPIPPELYEAAMVKLNGGAEAHVRMQGDGSLSSFRRAARRRAERAKQKAAKMARKRNRP